MSLGLWVKLSNLNLVCPFASPMYNWGKIFIKPHLNFDKAKLIQVTLLTTCPIDLQAANRQGSNLSTTPITAMGCRQCLPLSVVQLKGKHCQKTIAVNPIAVAGCILHRACLLFSSIYRIMSSLNKTICKKKTLWNLYEKNIKECADQRCIMKKKILSKRIIV